MYWVAMSLMRYAARKPLNATGALICIAMLLVAIGADVIAPKGYNAIDPLARLKPPSFVYWMGTDQLGRSVFDRIVHGARMSVIIGFAGAALSLVISTVIGLISGYFGGRVDMVLQRFVDSWMSFPDLLILAVGVSVFAPSLSTIIIMLGVILGIHGSRIVRASVLSIKENTYVHAAHSIGSSDLRIMWTHILPNAAPVLIVLFTTRLGIVILSDASLSFLGLGLPPPSPSWGAILSAEGRSFMFLAPWIAIFPGVVLTLLVFGIFLVGDALRDILDPRLRSAGRGSSAKVMDI